MLSSRLAALALVLACAGTALAQEKTPDDGVGGGPAGTDRTVTEGMLRTCPELKDAKGQRKLQLLGLWSFSAVLAGSINCSGWSFSTTVAGSINCSGFRPDGCFCPSWLGGSQSFQNFGE